MSEPIELYFWPTPNGWKVTIALEEMGLPYRIVPIDISKGEQFGDRFLKLSPNAKMPAIVDPRGPNGKPVSVFESGAILQYLGRKTGKFYPAEEAEKIAVEQWLFWQMAGLGPMTGQYGHFNTFADEKIPYAIERYRNEVTRLHRVLEKQLEHREFIAGDYSIADMACWPWVKSAAFFGFDLTDLPHLAAWLDRIGDRPAVKKGGMTGMELRGPPPQGSAKVGDTE